MPYKALFYYGLAGTALDNLLRKELFEKYHLFRLPERA